MRRQDAGYVARMEETPICASVEKDLDITVDELVTGAAATLPAAGRTDDAAAR